MDIKELTRLCAALRRSETMLESGIFSGWALSAAYTSAKTAWNDPCQETRPWLPADIHGGLPVLWWRPLYSYSVHGFVTVFRNQNLEQKFHS